MDLKTVTDRTIFLTRTGSHAYGLDTPESDEDYRGVCVPTKEYFFGLDRFDQQEYPGEDKVVYDIRKAFRLFADANPNMLELLFIDSTKCPIWSVYWDKVVENRNLFLSSKSRYTYTGYAISQLRRVKGHKKWIDKPVVKPHRADYGLPESETTFPPDLVTSVIASSDYVKPEFKQLALKEKRYREAKREWDNYSTWLKKRNRKRFELEQKYSYDVKHASHLVRLIRQGEELLKTGHLFVDRTDIDADELRAIKTGAWSYEELIKYADDMDERFDKLYKTTCLPKKPDRKKINELCVNLCRQFIENYENFTASH